MHKSLKGARITAQGITVTIDKVFYSDITTPGAYDIEFIDAAGNYRHWKQYFDGGRLEFQGRKLINCYGSDVTDLFKKYGYKI